MKSTFIPGHYYKSKETYLCTIDIPGCSRRAAYDQEPRLCLPRKEEKTFPQTESDTSKDIYWVCFVGIGGGDWCYNRNHFIDVTDSREADTHVYYNIFEHLPRLNFHLTHYVVNIYERLHEFFIGEPYDYIPLRRNSTQVANEICHEIDFT
jgi:hypothetical protein